MHLNSPVLMGERNLSSTWWKKLGIPPSRAKANIIRELDVILNNQQCQTFYTVSTYIIDVE